MEDPEKAEDWRFSSIKKLVGEDDWFGESYIIFHLRELTGR